MTIKASLDSGGSESLVTANYVRKLRIKDSQKKTTWSTPAGNLTTKKKVKARFTLPELQDSLLIEWDLHVTDNLGAHDMIIGRDMLEFLKIDIKFSMQTVEWGAYSMPFKDPKVPVHESYHLEDPDGLEEQTDRIRRILDTKYAPADLHEVCREQQHLSPSERDKLYNLPDTHGQLFDGLLGQWQGSDTEL